jgi:methionyl-tRNA formyltransferase
MKEFKIGLFVDGVVGTEIAQFVITKHPNDLSFICVTSFDSPLKEWCIEFGYSEHKIFTIETLPHNLNDIDYFILAWWPHIVKESLFNIPKIGTLNFHPSFLPYNKGKHPTFWNIIEEVPYGVTIHFVDNGIDSGDIVFQKEIEKNWIDTGFSLYQKSLKAIVQLFIENYDNIKLGKYERKIQPNYGTFHYSKELKSKLELKLDDKMKVKELINLLRAKDFPDSPQCYFMDNGEKYTVKIKIEKS